MTTPRPQASLQSVEHAIAEHLNSLQGRCLQVRRLHGATIRQFVQGVNILDLNGSRLLDWLTKDMPSRAGARRRLGIIACFLEKLVCGGLLRTNLLAEFRTHHGNASWRVLAKAFQAADPHSALAELARPTLLGPLEDSIQTYMALHQAMGKAYRRPRFVLQDFNRFLQLQSVNSPQEITSELVRCWLKSRRSYRPHDDLLPVSRFFDYLKQIDVVAVNPITVVSCHLGRRPPQSFRPFIFTHEQIAAMLSKAQQLSANVRFPLRAPTCYTMLALLYGLGLRHGEARRLQIQDLDSDRQTLFIRETKFHKSRYVPFGPKVGQCLGRFLELRRTILAPVREDDPIFMASTPSPIGPNVLLVAFRTMLKELRIAEAATRPPRLHDLRHTFAVHRLLRWYRENVDVQSRLMALSTFLGHVDPGYTQVYLTITNDVLQQANERFYKHCGQAVNEEASL